MSFILALDFDGVISDSLLEAYLITQRIAGAFDQSLAPAQKKLPTLAGIHRFRDRNREHWQAFLSLVPFGNRGEDYLVIQKAVKLGRSFSSQEEFDSFRAAIMDKNTLDAFHEEFYRERYALEARDRERWLALNAPYPGVKEALENLALTFQFSVATSKDERSVRALLASYGVDGLFQPVAILDKTAGVSKRSHLEHLRRLFCCRYEEISFVDDKVAQLLACHDLGVNLYLAAWGYNGPQERELAGSRGIRVLELKDFPFISPWL